MSLRLINGSLWLRPAASPPSRALRAHEPAPHQGLFVASAGGLRRLHARCARMSLRRKVREFFY